jgi:arsenical pump membrane protein
MKGWKVEQAKETAKRHWAVVAVILTIAAITGAALWTTGALRPVWERFDNERPEAIVWGTPIDHEDRGPCTSCHAVVTARGTLLPTISSLSGMPHEFRGVCNNCHRIGEGALAPSRGVVPTAATTEVAAPSASNQGAIAYSTLALVVLLAVGRPRIGALGFRFTPGTAALVGVTILFFAGALTFEDMLASAVLQWRPLLTLACIMIMTGVVQEVGVFERIAARIEAHARRRSAAAAFTSIFVVSVITAALLNNDSAILVLTPLVIALTRRLYPHRPELTVAFAFAVFLAPGVAPFVISNPMNMIVAEFAGIGFNAYARVMLPVSLSGALLTYTILRFRFRDSLAATPARVLSVRRLPPHRAEASAIVLMLTAFASYPLMAALGGPVWVVSLAAALASLGVAIHYRVAPPRELWRHVSGDILVFLWAVFLVVVGLRNVGVVDRLASVYRAVPRGSLLEVGVVGSVAALGSALVDNHPMSLLNMMALGAEGGSRPLLAALIGGDIGPRLLPIGSLAGLLWMDLLRRAGVDIGIGRFVRLGTLVLLPTLTLSLFMLWLFTAP